MPQCPKCDFNIDSQAIKCPRCNYLLKAFGHPGIPLYQTGDDTFLCDSCIYHEDDSCNYPNRPYAKSCTLFHDRSLPLVVEESNNYSMSARSFLDRLLAENKFIIGILILVLISVLITIF